MYNHCHHQQNRFKRYRNDKAVFDPVKKIIFANEMAAQHFGVTYNANNPDTWDNVDILCEDKPANAFEGYTAYKCEYFKV